MSEARNSHAFLPAVRVKDACFSAIKEIAVSRELVSRDVVEGYMKSSLFMVFLTRKAIYKRLPPELREVAELHRAEEERVIIALMELSRAACEDDEEFRVYVSAADFTLISKYYGNRSDI